MNHYLIESLAPLVFRSGKPFGSQASAQDVIFPLPSAGAGLIRAIAIGQGNLTMGNQRLRLETMDSDEQYQKVLATRAQGPFLVRYKDERDVEVLVPKPTNALYLEDKQSGEVKLLRLAPQSFPDLCGSDLPEGLLPVQLQTPMKGKPKGGATYWRLDDLIRWQCGEDLTFADVSEHGLNELPIDIRTHVSIDDDTLASEDGKLFQTANFDLAHRRNEKPEESETWTEKRLGFLIQSEQVLAHDLATFGGERRLSHFKKLDTSPTRYQGDIAERLQDIKDKKGLMLTFLTPVIFEKGYLPRWIKDMQGTLPDTDIKVTLKAVAIDRWQGISGWDSILWKPKATRKAVSAGAVYWFEINNPDALTAETLKTLETHVWSDHKQDQNDGFGSALLTAWQTL